MAILFETVHTNFTATGTSSRVCNICWQGYGIRILLKIGCTLAASSAETQRSFSGLRKTKSYLRNRMSDERSSDLHSCTCIMTLTLMTSVQSLLLSTRRWCAFFTSRIHVHGKGPRKLTLNQNYNVKPWLLGGGKVICRKKSFNSVFWISFDPWSKIPGCRPGRHPRLPTNSV